MKSKTAENLDEASRWEDHLNHDPLATRLRFASGMVGMSHWRFDGRPSQRANRPVTSRLGVGMVGALLRALGTLRTRNQRIAETRKGVQALSRLDDHLLRDIGLYHGQIAQMQSGMMSLADIAAARNRPDIVTGTEETPVSSVAVIGHAGGWDCANDSSMRQAA